MRTGELLTRVALSPLQQTRPIDDERDWRQRELLLVCGIDQKSLAVRRHVVEPPS